MRKREEDATIEIGGALTEEDLVMIGIEEETVERGDIQETKIEREADRETDGGVDLKTKGAADRETEEEVGHVTEAEDLEVETGGTEIEGMTGRVVELEVGRREKTEIEEIGMGVREQRVRIRKGLMEVGLRIEKLLLKVSYAFL